jgi:hypothetical protein
MGCDPADEASLVNELRHTPRGEQTARVTPG